MYAEGRVVLAENGADEVARYAPYTWIDLGRIAYRPAFAFQEKLHAQRLAGTTGDVILFQENDPVITMGRTGGNDNVLVTEAELQRRGIEVVEVNRGGDVTYHGPGQLVVSPIIRLHDRLDSIRRYLRQLEAVVINLLANYGIAGDRIEGESGVWVGNDKIAAVGIAIRNGITLHGTAINIHPDLSHFSLIVPCGLGHRGVTSLHELGVTHSSLPQVRNDFLSAFSAVFEAPVVASHKQSHHGSRRNHG
jgi:lipoyl(octanoyl) transferase